MFVIISGVITTLSVRSGYSTATRYVDEKLTQLLVFAGVMDEPDRNTQPEYYPEEGYYETLEDFLVSEEPIIMYPSELPDGVEIDKVNILKEYSAGKMSVEYSFYGDTLSINVNNYYSEDKNTLHTAFTYTSDIGKTYYVYNSVDDDMKYHAVCRSDGFEYLLASEDYDLLTFMMNSMTYL